MVLFLFLVSFSVKAKQHKRLVQEVLYYTWNNVLLQEREQILLAIVKNAAEIFASSKVFFFVNVKTKRFLFGNCKTRST